MKLSAKLALGFGIVLLLLLALAGVSTLSLNDSSEGFAEYRGLARDSNLSGRLQANMLMVRLAVKDYIITASDDSLEQFNAYFAKMRGFMDEAQKEIQKPERAAFVDEADEEVKQYSNHFKKVTQLQDERNQLVENVLNKNGPQVERNLTAILRTAERDGDMEAAFRSGLAIRSLLLARLYAFKFLNDNLKASADRAFKELQDFNNELNELDANLENPERRRLLAEARSLGNGYADTFTKVTSVIYARNEITSKYLNVLEDDIAHKVEQVKLSVIADQDHLGPKLQAANNQTFITLMIIAGIALAIGIGTAWFIIRSITRPLAESVGYATDVSEGDLTVAIKCKGNDEITRLSEALSNMVAQISRVVGNVRSGSASVAEGSGELSATAQSLSEGATEQAASIEEISASMEEMVANIQQNTQNAVTTEGIANQSAEEADESGVAVAQAVSAMHNIAEKISIIEEIARPERRH